MTDAWKSLTPAQKRAAEETFAALSAFDYLMEGAKDKAEDSAERPIGFGDVYAFATGLEPPTQALREALLRDRQLRSALDRLLDKTALYQFPKVAAAASGTAEGRDGDKYRIRLKVSRAAPRQTYVIIELQDQTFKLPSALFYRKPDGEYGVHPLPDPEGGVIQVLADSDSNLVTALRNVDTEVYLR